MSNRTDDAALHQIYAYWREMLRDHVERRGPMKIVVVEEIIGRSGVEFYLRNGEPADLFLGFTLDEHRDWVARSYGRPWYTGRLTIAADGSFDDPVCDYDRPPASEKLRTLGNYVADLELYPRPPELVPGWMKVELAAVGAWDLRADRPSWKDYEPTGEPQTPESVGVPPPGAEWALAR